MTNPTQRTTPAFAPWRAPGSAAATEIEFSDTAVALPPAAGQPLIKSRDFVHYYHGFHEPGARCRIRLYESAHDHHNHRRNPRVPVVLCSDVFADNNTSVTNLAEHIAAEVALQIFFDQLPAGALDEFLNNCMNRLLGRPTVPFHWIEHYPAGKFALEELDLLKMVRFGSYAPTGTPMLGLMHKPLSFDRTWVADSTADPDSGWQITTAVRNERLALGDPYWWAIESREELESWLGVEIG